MARHKEMTNHKGKEDIMAKPRKKKQGGFTLIELLIVILIVGILAAVAMPLYLGYVGDAKTAEAKSLVGAMWTALRGCAQVNAGTACAANGQFGRVGLTASGVTPDGRWTIRSTDTVTMNSTTSVYTLTAGILATGAALTDVAGILVELNYNIANNPPGNFTCTAGGGAPSPC